jgi:hypothetical protein
MYLADGFTGKIAVVLCLNKYYYYYDKDAKFYFQCSPFATHLCELDGEDGMRSTAGIVHLRGCCNPEA